MVNKCCLKCNIVFNRKYSYDRHINKKFNCELIKDKLNEKKICKSEKKLMLV